MAPGVPKAVLREVVDGFIRLGFMLALYCRC